MHLIESIDFQQTKSLFFEIFGIHMDFLNFRVMLHKYLIRIFFIAFFLILPIQVFCQVQIHQDIQGESAGDESGYSVALSSDGNILAIGARKNSGSAASSGHVKVYRNTSSGWSQIGSDIDGVSEGDFFGSAVALSSDGNFVAVGAVQSNLSSETNGYVRVYENINENWVQRGLEIEGEAMGDQSGMSIALSSNANIIAIGAPGSAGQKGQARVYEYLNTSWTQLGSDIDGVNANGFLGRGVSLSANGDILAVGIPNSGSGEVKIFQNIGGSWIQIGDSLLGTSDGDLFGWNVSLSSDGNTIAIGAPFNGDSSYRAGQVSIYQNTGGSWNQVGNTIDGQYASGRLGNSVSISSDGTIIAVGAEGIGANGNFSGYAQVFKNINGNWNLIGNTIEGEAAGDRSGWSISLSSDGNKVAVGGYLNDGNGMDSGYTRVYDLNNVLSVGSENLLQFGMYPNPAKDSFTIQMSQNSVLKAVNIYNLLGQLVSAIKENETIVDVIALDAGVYMVEILTNNGNAIKKLVIE